MVTKEEFTEKILRMQEEKKKEKEQERRDADRVFKDYISDSVRRTRQKWKKRFYH